MRSVLSFVAFLGVLIALCFAQAGFCQDELETEEANVLWSYAAGGLVYGVPAIDPSGNVCVSSSDGMINFVGADGVVKWKYQIPDGQACLAPAIGQNGNVYVVNNVGTIYKPKNQSGVSVLLLIGLDSNGNELWRTKLGVGSSSSPVVSSKGDVWLSYRPYETERAFTGLYDWAIRSAVDLATDAMTGNDYTRGQKMDASLFDVSGTDLSKDDADSLFARTGEDWGVVYRFNPDGKDSGKVKGSSPCCEPLIDADDNVFSAYYNKKFMMITGDKKKAKGWVIKLGQGGNTMPLMTDSGLIYVVSGEGQLSTGKVYGISSAGEKVWAFDLGGTALTRGALGADGTLYLPVVYENTGGFCSLFAISPQGQVLWSIKPQCRLTPPAVAPNGDIVVGEPMFGHIFVVSSSGELKHRIKAGPIISSAPVIRQDGVMIVGTANELKAIALPE
jgi:hypothetical protein